MALREPQPRFISHQIAMVVRRNRQAERTDQEQLPSGRLQQIGTAHDFRDLHGSVIGDHGELIRRNIVAPPNHEVAEIVPCDITLRALMKIVECDLLIVRNPEAPVHSGWSVEALGLPCLFAAAAGIHWLIVTLVRSGCCQREVLA